MMDMKRVQEIERKPVFVVGTRALDDKDVAFLVQTIKEQHSEIKWHEKKYDDAIEVIRDYTHRDKRAYNIYKQWCDEQDALEEDLND